MCLDQPPVGVWYERMASAIEAAAGPANHASVIVLSILKSAAVYAARVIVVWPIAFSSLSTSALSRTARCADSVVYCFHASDVTPSLAGANTWSEHAASSVLIARHARGMVHEARGTTRNMGGMLRRPSRT